MMDANIKRKLPWGKMAKWGGLCVLAMFGLCLVLYPLGIVGDAQSDLMGKGIGVGLVAVVTAAMAAPTKE